MGLGNSEMTWENVNHFAFEEPFGWFHLKQAWITKPAFVFHSKTLFVVYVLSCPIFATFFHVHAQLCKLRDGSFNISPIF